MTVHPPSPAPDTPELADAAAGWRAAYVHIPFCARICPYCDFAVVAGAEDRIEEYVRAVRAEIARESPWEALDAVFFGGGTPSHIEPLHIGSILRDLSERFGLQPGAEVSIEANPEDWSPGRASALRRAGVTRVSFGAQSFDAGTLRYLGRRHQPEDITAAVRHARAAGFDSVGLDLIFGSPGEPVDAWEQTVTAAADLAPDHISTYALTVERGTPLSRAVAAGAPAPDPDAQADAYERAMHLLGSAGYVHYEVSNWARAHHACRYNLIVWAQGEYLGFGLGAHRHRDHRRSWNVRRLEAYLDRIAAGASPISGSETLAAVERDRERIMIGLRRRAGVRADSTGRLWIETEDFGKLTAAGITRVAGDRIVVTDPLRTDTAARSVAGLALPGEISSGA